MICFQSLEILNYGTAQTLTYLFRKRDKLSNAKRKQTTKEMKEMKEVNDYETNIAYILIFKTLVNQLNRLRRVPSSCQWRVPSFVKDASRRVSMTRPVI